jgi:tRNA threonylcarbamoyladenosine biosynthesis protein TsaB
MAILAFDTCLGAVSVALRTRAANGDWLIREAYEARQTGHAERLMPMIAEVMASAGRDFSQIEQFAVTVGPGTFTGVRVGVAAARAFALSTGRPVVGISSLEVIDARGRHLLGPQSASRAILVATDARRGALYAALYDPSKRASDGAPALLTAEAAAALATTHNALVIGSGAPLVDEAATAAGHPIETALPAIEPHARFLAQLAAGRPPTDTVSPLYLRAPDVKPQPQPIARRP